MDGLLDYLEDTYIGRLRNGRRRAPIFALELWNMYERTVDGLARTNNNVEGWHRGIQFPINACHPNFWKFLDVLKREENSTRVGITQCLGGHPDPPRKKTISMSMPIDVDCNERIYSMSSRFIAVCLRWTI